MARSSRSEVLGYIAAHEPLEKTLARFPDWSREQLRALLRDAAVVLAAEDAGVPEMPAEPSPAPPAPAPRPARAQPAERLPPRASPAVPHDSLEIERPTPAAPAGEPARVLRVYSDGAARGNPGPAGAGAVVMKSDGTIVARLGKYLGTQTNNHAEYTALLLGLKAALELGANEVEVFADSELLIRQLQGAYKVKSPTLRPLFDEARELLTRFRRSKLTHVPREMNQLADEMSNRAIDERL